MMSCTRRFAARCAALLLLVVASAIGTTGPAGAETINMRSMGAVGDGIADDTAALQKVLDSLPQGGTAYLPAGRYRITDALRVRTKTRLIGDGPASQIFCPTEGWNLDTTKRFGMLTIMDADDVEIAAISMRGTVEAAHMTTPKFIYLERARRINIHDNQFENAGFEGLWQGGKQEQTTDIVVSRNHFRNVGRPAGRYVGLPAIQMSAMSSIISENILRDVGTGIGASGSKTSVIGNRIEGVEVAGIGTGDAGEQAGMIVSGNTVFLSSAPGHPRVGILVDPAIGVGQPVLISGNMVHVEGRADHASPIGIRVVKGSTASLIGNVVTVNSKGVGIQVLGHKTPTNALLSGNSVHIIGELATSSGIGGVPNGRDGVLTVTSSGNRVTGANSMPGSFAIDFNSIAGGQLSVTSSNDQVAAGLVRFGTTMHKVEPGAGRLFSH